MGLAAKKKKPARKEKRGVLGKISLKKDMGLQHVLLILTG